MLWSPSLILIEGEQVVHSWEGIYNKPHIVHVKEQSFGRTREIKRETTEYKQGVLVLTNQRLIWLERRNTFDKSYHSVFKIYLRTLQGISMGGSLFKYVTIVDSVKQYAHAKQYDFNLSGIGDKEMEPFKDRIMRQKEKVGVAQPRTEPTAS